VPLGTVSDRLLRRYRGAQGVVLGETRVDEFRTAWTNQRPLCSSKPRT
jgi:hypothetical protein